MTEIKKILPEGIEYDDEGFRQSTPPEIAEYKAKRLGGESIADLGSGIGVQAVFFSRYFRTVLAVEKDRERYRIAERNFRRLALNNVKIIHGDVFNKGIKDEISSCEILFSDPSRPVRGGEWTLDILSPSPPEIVKNFPSNEKFSFDIPVQISMDRIFSDYELEYISLDGEIKRLSIYSPSLKLYDRSALILPEGARLVHDPDLQVDVPRSDEVLHFLYEIDPSITYAHLLPEFFHIHKDFHLLLDEKKRTIATSDNFRRDPLIKNTYVVSFKAGSFREIKENLRKNSARRVFLRYSVNSGEYYRIKAELEKNMDGENDFYIFKKGKEFIGAIKLKV